MKEFDWLNHYNTVIYEAHIHYLSLSSFNLEVIVGNILTLNTFLSDIYKTNDTTWWSVTEASKSDTALHKLFSLVPRHILTVICINITPDEGTSWATKSPVTILEVTRGIDLVDLVAFVGVPTRTDHCCREGIFIGINDLAHHSCCRLYRWQSTKLRSLDVHVVADISGNGTGVRWSTRSLAVDALVNGL